MCREQPNGKWVPSLLCFPSSLLDLLRADCCEIHYHAFGRQVFSGRPSQPFQPPLLPSDHLNLATKSYRRIHVLKIKDLLVETSQRALPPAGDSAPDLQPPLLHMPSGLSRLPARPLWFQSSSRLGSTTRSLFRRYPRGTPQCTMRVNVNQYAPQPEQQFSWKPTCEDCINYLPSLYTCSMLSAPAA